MVLMMMISSVSHTLHHCSFPSSERQEIPQTESLSAYLHTVPGDFGWQVLKSQHSPVAQVALGKTVQVVASQHGLSQWSFRPQSHCSPGSTKPLPQTGLSNRVRGLLRRQ